VPSASASSAGGGETSVGGGTTSAGGGAASADPGGNAGITGGFDNAVAPALAFAAHGVRFGLGSDNTRFNGFRTLDAAEHAQRLAYGLRTSDFSAGAAWTWVDAISRGSADAAGFSGVGTLESGAAADFLILDTQRPETIVSWDFEWELVRYYDRDQIAFSVVGGKPVLAAGQPLDWDASAFLREHAATGRRIGSSPGITRVHGGSQLHRPSRAESSPSRERARPVRPRGKHEP
jgi:5-methylthioadenosine/S-adenosylhomocysteine deaminase